MDEDGADDVIGDDSTSDGGSATSDEGFDFLGAEIPAQNAEIVNSSRKSC